MRKIILYISLTFLLLSSCTSNTTQAPTPPKEMPQESIHPLRAPDAHEFIYYSYQGENTSHLNNRKIASMRSFKAPVDETSYFLEITFDDANETVIIFRDDILIVEKYADTFRGYQTQLSNASQSTIASRNTQTRVSSFFTNNDIVRYTPGDLRISFSKDQDKRLLGLITIFETTYTREDGGADNDGKVFVSFYLDEEGLQQFISAMEHVDPNTTDSIE